MQLHHLQFAAITKITRRNIVHKNTRNILGNPSQQREENPTILCYILKRNTSHTIDLAHKRVLSKTKKASTQERCALQP
jgi:hypothetical protein